MSENNGLDEFLKNIFKNIVFKALICRVGDVSLMNCAFGMNQAIEKIFFTQ